MDQFRLDICLFHSGFFLKPNLMSSLQKLLKEIAPLWSSQLRLGESCKWPHLSLTSPEALGEAVEIETGPVKNGKCRGAISSTLSLKKNGMGLDSRVDLKHFRMVGFL